MVNVVLELDLIIDMLTKQWSKTKLHEQLSIRERDAYMISQIAKSIFEAEQLCLEINENVNVVGDIHGQYDDLLRIFSKNGKPPHCRYLFLGDYVDRGIFSLETIMLLFCYKIKYPEHIFLLRGNHETKSISSIYGFRDEIKQRYGMDSLWKSYCAVFSQMPVCAIVLKYMFCCHGGLSPVFLEDRVRSGQQGLIDFINNRKRPYVVVMGAELFDTLWSDPEETPGPKNPMFKFGNRQCTCTYNEVAVLKFLKKFQLQKIIRAHQPVKEGFKFCFKKKL